MPTIIATQLQKDDVLLLPFGRTAKVLFAPQVGRLFVSFVTPFGKTRVEKFDEIQIEEREVKS